MTEQNWNDMVDQDRIVYDAQVKRMVDGGLLEEDAKDIAKVIFDLSFKEGQQFVWFQRSGFGGKL
jgi:hypothetical protein